MIDRSVRPRNSGGAGGAGVRRRNRRTLAPLAAILVAMALLAASAPKLYRLFCASTGFGGTTQRAAAGPAAIGPAVIGPTVIGLAGIGSAGIGSAGIGGRRITVRFDANVNGDLPWRFAPEQASLETRAGETSIALFRAENRSRDQTSGQATYNVTPAKAGAYFDKVQCFCFNEQTLAAGQVVDMPVSFFVDPAISADRNMDEVTTITLSYTFFRAKPSAPTKPQAVTAAAIDGADLARLTPPAGAARN